MNENDNKTKKCKTCGLILPLNSYSIRKWRSSAEDAHWIFSYYGDCRSCVSRKKHEYYLRRKNILKLQKNLIK